jgi:hypothetical protein
VDWSVTSFRPSQAIYSRLAQLVTNSPLLQQLQGLTAGSAAFGIQPISESAISAGVRRGGNALGLAAVNQTWFHIDVGWWSSQDDARAVQVGKDLIEHIETETKSQGIYLPYLFMNDASADQDVIAHYGSKNVRKLKEVQARYDPHRVFQTLVPGGFKIGKRSCPLSESLLKIYAASNCSSRA